MANKDKNAAKKQKVIKLEVIFESNVNGGFDTKNKATKAKTNKANYVKLKSFCIAKEPINKMKKQPTE